MPTPNSTTKSTLTVTDSSSFPVSNLSVCTLHLTYPDETTSTLTLGSGVTNIGNGQYQATYQTKGAGVIVELWNVVGSDGVTTGEFRFEIGVGY